MSEENLPTGPRPQPRYQPPAMSGSAATGGEQRPNDWPAPNYSPPQPGYGAWGNYQPGDPTEGYPPNPGGYGYPYGLPYKLSKKVRRRMRRYQARNDYRHHHSDYNYMVGPETMVPPVPEDPQAAAYRQAARRVEARLRFYKHLTIYLMINGFLWFIALATVHSGSLMGRIWPIWITVFWGIGLFSEWWRVFGSDDRRREDMIQEELRRMRNSANK